MEHIPATLKSINVTQFQADFEFTPEAYEIVLDCRFNYFPHTDPKNFSVLVRAESSANSPLKYRCRFEAIFTYPEKPDDLGAWVKAQCFPMIAQQAERMFSSILSTLHKSIAKN